MSTRDTRIPQLHQGAPSGGRAQLLNILLLLLVLVLRVVPPRSRLVPLLLNAGIDFTGGVKQQTANCHGHGPSAFYLLLIYNFLLL